MDGNLNRYACQYAVIRFSPFPETEEFVNIGIAIICPKANYFNFKIKAKKRHGRVTDFFPEIGKDLYREAIEMFDRELSRIKLIADSGNPKAPEEIRALFQQLIHPREALVQFSAPRVRMTDNPDEILNKLFAYYVERNFVTAEYKEQTLERRIRNLVHGLNLPSPFRSLEVGDEFAAAQFPLVQKYRNEPIKAIKPFYLAQSEPAKIITHGGLWVDRLRRMRNRQTLPSAVLFAVHGPNTMDEKRYSAYEEICDDLRKLDIITISDSNEEEIIRFAKNPVFPEYQFSDLL